MASIFTGKATGVSPKPIDSLQARQAILFLADPEHSLELRGLPSGRSFVRHSTDVDGLIQCANRLGDDRGIYYCLNPVQNGIGDRGARAADIIRRRWILLDVDPSKPTEFKDASATDAEHEAARQTASKVHDWLSEQGWPAPVLVDSGNGWHLLYRIDLPNDPLSQALVRKVLYVLAGRFDNAGAAVDKSVHNASRIAKLPGTWARKGPSTTERPHRLCRILFMPAEQEVVPLALLQKVAGDVKEALPLETPTLAAPTASIFNGTAPTNGTAASYARAAIRNEQARVALAIQGERNNALNRAAYSLGGLVSLGYLREAEVIEALREAANRAGLDVDPECGPKGIEATIRSGLEAGKAAPRTVPETPRNGACSHPQETEPPRQEQNGKAKTPTIYTLPSLLLMDIPPPVWAVPGILSEGLSILAGKPKLGKSWAALNLAITIAAGGMAFGETSVVAGDVLYLSLEDRLRRVQSRARKVLGGLSCGASDRLHIAVEWPRQGDGGLEYIEKWLESMDSPRLVIVDVWQKFRPALKQGGSQYEQDYNHASALKSVGDRANCSILVIHHCKKAKHDDVVDEISGTLGLAGAADGLLVLTRARNENEAEMFISGRDIEERQMALTFDPTNFVWKSCGNAAEHTEGKLKSALIAIFKVNADTVLSVGEIAQRLSIPEHRHASMRTVINRMVDDGLISRIGPGRFKWPVKHPEEGDGIAF